MVSPPPFCVHGPCVSGHHIEGCPCFLVPSYFAHIRLCVWKHKRMWPSHVRGIIYYCRYASVDIHEHIFMLSAAHVCSLCLECARTTCARAIFGEASKRAYICTVTQYSSPGELGVPGDSVDDLTKQSIEMGRQHALLKQKLKKAKDANGASNPPSS
jgi:hypothetical protein